MPVFILTQMSIFTHAVREICIDFHVKYVVAPVHTHQNIFDTVQTSFFSLNIHIDIYFISLTEVTTFTC